MGLSLRLYVQTCEGRHGQLKRPEEGGDGPRRRGNRGPLILVTRRRLPGFAGGP